MREGFLGRRLIWFSCAGPVKGRSSSNEKEAEEEEEEEERDEEASDHSPVSGAGLGCVKWRPFVDCLCIMGSGCC